MDNLIFECKSVFEQIDELFEETMRDLDKRTIPFDEIEEKWKGTHASLSKIGKVTEKKLSGENFRIGTTDEEKMKGQLVEAIADHLFRSGNASVVEKIQNFPQALQIKSHFDNLQFLSDSLDRNDINPALEWTFANAHFLGGLQASRLEFSLKSLGFFIRVAEGWSPGQIVEYARTNLSPFKDAFVRDVEVMAGCLSFLPDLENGPYRYLNLEDVREDTKSALSTYYCAIYNLPRQSGLSVR